MLDNVRHAQEDQDAWVYLQERVAGGLEPDIEYVRSMLDGAREHNLRDREEELLEVIRRTESKSLDRRWK